jgi:hypothetical protein
MSRLKEYPLEEVSLLMIHLIKGDIKDTNVSVGRRREE